MHWLGESHLLSCFSWEHLLGGLFQMVNHHRATTGQCAKETDSTWGSFAYSSAPHEASILLSQTVPFSVSESFKTVVLRTVQIYRNSIQSYKCDPLGVPPRVVWMMEVFQVKIELHTTLSFGGAPTHHQNVQSGINSTIFPDTLSSLGQTQNRHTILPRIHLFLPPV